MFLFAARLAVPRASWRHSGCASGLVVLVALAALAGCASVATGPQGGATAPPLPRTAEPPPPGINLSGFPLAYRQGYADGCGSATGPERRDAARFGAEPNYRTGWQDGLALCKKR